MTDNLILTIAISVVVPIIIALITTRPGIKRIEKERELSEIEKRRLQEEITEKVLARANQYIEELETRNELAATEIRNLTVKVRDLEIENDNLRIKYAEIVTNYKAALKRIEKLEKGDTGPLKDVKT